MGIEAMLMPAEYAATLSELAQAEADLATDGGDAVKERVVQLRAEAAKPVWIQVAKPGQFRGHAAGPFELNETIFNEIIRNFKATANQRIPIDFEHASEQPATQGSIPTDGAPAQGWILDLKIEDGNLWGLVTWGEKARDYIRSGQYRYFSPAIRFAAKDRVTGERIGARMTSGAICNQPFLDGMKPLLATDQEELALALTDAHLALSAESALLRDARAELSTLAASLEEATTKLTETEADLVMLREERAQREEADIAEDIEVAYATYETSMNLNDVRRRAMLSHRRVDADGFRAMYPRVAAHERHLLRDLSGGRPPGTPTTNMTDPVVVLDVRQLAKKISQQRGVTLGQAQLLVEKMVNDQRAGNGPQRGAR